MNLRIKATKIKLTPQIKDYVQKKMDMLEKYLGDFPVIHADFEVEMTTKHHQKGDIFRAEANMNLAGHFMRVEKTEKDLYKAIDKVKDHLKDMIVEYKNVRRGE
ncbi:ribosome-associated translation inhibitor RaiA [Candidatus Falkowbacteria bacterium]|nr:ribosome-associated translation inhibitor RaiA [Candidatus Falkowbacteria bacterium]